MENNKNMRELYEIYLELVHKVFEEKIKEPMEICLHNSASNVISINSLDTIIAKAVEKPKLGGACLKKSLFCSSDRKSTRLNSSHITRSRMPSSA